MQAHPVYIIGGFILMVFYSKKCTALINANLLFILLKYNWMNLYPKYKRYNHLSKMLNGNILMYNSYKFNGNIKIIIIVVFDYYWVNSAFSLVENHE